MTRLFNQWLAAYDEPTQAQNQPSSAFGQSRRRMESKK